MSLSYLYSVLVPIYFNCSIAKRVDQIQRLLDLPQPVQQDTTYEIPERFPPRRRNEAKVAADRTTKKVQPLKHAVRTGINADVEVVRIFCR